VQKVVIRDEIAALTEYWSQKVIAEANGQLFKVAKGTGDINWHQHDDQDELFILQAGRMTIELRTAEIPLAPGELLVVPKGVEHRVREAEEAAEGGKPAWSFAGQEPAE
jgi:mannose-6-phosphate isomerase-like protein (cupin superfamily)